MGFRGLFYGEITLHFTTTKGRNRTVVKNYIVPGVRLIYLEISTYQENLRGNLSTSKGSGYLLFFIECTHLIESPALKYIQIFFIMYSDCMILSGVVKVNTQTLNSTCIGSNPKI